MSDRRERLVRRTKEIAWGLMVLSVVAVPAVAFWGFVWWKMTR